jgi:hypothetical protein
LDIFWTYLWAGTLARFGSDRPTHPKSDAEFGAQIAYPGSELVHGTHGQAQLGGGHLIGPATIAGAGGGQARFGPLEFGQGGKLPKTSLPSGNVVSMLAPCPVSTLKPMPRAVKSCTALTR